MKAKNLINLVVLSSMTLLGCQTTPCDKRIEMFEKGKHLEDWPWVNNPSEYLHYNRFNQIRIVLWANCVLFRYNQNDNYFLAPEIAAYLREQYKKDSE